MPDLSTQIAKAKQAGYSDGEIASFLGKDPTYGSKIAEAKKAGYDDAEIVGHLASAASPSGKHVSGGIEDYVASQVGAKTKVQQDAERRVAGEPNALRAFTTGLTWGGAGDIDALGAGLETAIGNTAKRVMGKPIDYTAGEARKAVKQANVLADAAYAKEHPIESTAINVGGALLAPGTGAAGKFIGGGATAGMKALRAAGVGAGGGALYGALTAPEGQRGENALTGAAIGGVSGGATQGVLNAFGPKAAVDSAARRLSREGVDLTPGQMMGGLGKRVEDLLTSAPLTGNAINSMRRKGIDSFRKATFDKALAPLGASLPDGVGTGNEAVAHTQKVIGDAYDKILPKLTFNFDPQLGQDLGDVANRIQSLPQDRGEQVSRILRDKVLAPLQGAKFDGAAWKQADAELGRLGSNYKSSPDADQREVGSVLQDAQKVLRDWMGRSNPSEAKAIGQANEAWANFTRIRDSAAATGANSAGGEFTPAQLLAATRRGDKSMGKGATARGEALMQDWAQDAQKTLPSNIPDSGTALRTAPVAYGAALLGGGPHGAGTALAADLAGAGLYTAPVQKALNAIYRATDRPTATQGVQGLKALAANNPKLLPFVQEIEARLTQAPNVAAQRQKPSGVTVEAGGKVYDGYGNVVPQSAP